MPGEDKFFDVAVDAPAGVERTFLQADAEAAAESVALFFNGLRERGVDEDSAHLFTQDWMELRFRSYHQIEED